MQGLFVNDLAAQDLLHRPLANEDGRFQGDILIAGGKVLRRGLRRLAGLALHRPLARRNLGRMALAEGQAARCRGSLWATLLGGLLGGRLGSLPGRGLGPCQGSTGGRILGQGGRGSLGGRCLSKRGAGDGRFYRFLSGCFCCLRGLAGASGLGNVALAGNVLRLISRGIVKVASIVVGVFVGYLFRGKGRAGGRSLNRYLASCRGRGGLGGCPSSWAVSAGGLNLRGQGHRMPLLGPTGGMVSFGRLYRVSLPINDPQVRGLVGGRLSGGLLGHGGRGRCGVALGGDGGNIPACHRVIPVILAPGGRSLRTGLAVGSPSLLAPTRALRHRNLWGRRHGLGGRSRMLLAHLLGGLLNRRARLAGGRLGHRRLGLAAALGGCIRAGALRPLRALTTGAT